MTIKSQAIAIIETYRNDAIIMEFVTQEAREKVASEIRAKCGGSTTAKGVALLECSRKNILDRVTHYVELGLIGCLVASVA